MMCRQFSMCISILHTLTPPAQSYKIAWSCLVYSKIGSLYEGKMGKEVLVNSTFRLIHQPLNLMPLASFQYTHSNIFPNHPVLRKSRLTLCKHSQKFKL